MASEPQQSLRALSTSTTKPAGMVLRGPSVFLVSFGGKKDGVGAFSLGKATGYDALASLLNTVGIQSADVEMALQVLAAQPHHEIPNVTLTRDLIRKLDL